MKQKKMNKNYRLHYKTVLTLVNVLKIVQENKQSNKILPDECIFCLKNSKHKARTKENLMLYIVNFGQ